VEFSLYFFGLVCIFFTVKGFHLLRVLSQNDLKHLTLDGLKVDILKKHLLFLTGIMLFISCRTQVQEISFFITTTSEYGIPSSGGVNQPFSITTPEIETKAQFTFTDNNTREGLVNEISLSSISLEVLEPVGGDFSFLSAIRIFIEASDLPEIEVASLNAADPNLALIFLETSDIDLQAYLKKERYTMRIITTNKEFLSEDIRLEIKSRFLVKAEPIETD
jgi:hypothetical protein